LQFSNKEKLNGEILVALGGNALIKRGEEGSAAQQLSNARHAAKEMVELLEAGNHLLITHGNGPQVGDILLQNEMAKSKVVPMPLDVCGAESQGMLGYILQQALDNEARRAGLNVSIVSIVSQTIVSSDDPAFQNPSKPVGPFYSKEEAVELEKTKSWKMMRQDDRGYRRLVPSPEPIEAV
jgi:carbamate kinase